MKHHKMHHKEHMKSEKKVPHHAAHMEANNAVMSNNAFVKHEEQKLKGMMGGRPGANPEMMHFDAHMSNNEYCVKEATHALTRNIDNAFPVK